MTSTQTGTLVLKDGAGSYFLVPQETLEQGRVPAERQAEVERLMAEAAAEGGADGDDVRGHLFWVIVGIAIGATVVGGATVLGIGESIENSQSSGSDAATVRAIGQVALGRGR